jgi:CrcB protein
MHRLCGHQFPWGTIAVNMTGCFLFGLIWALTEGRFAQSVQSRLILLTGFMGAFTTFSTYAFETSQLIQNSQYVLAFANGAGQLVIGISVMLIGLALGRLV